MPHKPLTVLQSFLSRRPSLSTAVLALVTGLCLAGCGFDGSNGSGSRDHILASAGGLGPSMVEVGGTLGVSPTQLSFNHVAGAQHPATQGISIGGEGRIWSASANQGWIKLLNKTGITPDTLAVGIDPTGVAPGTYTGQVTISSVGYETATVDVSLVVAHATLTASVASVALEGSPAQGPTSISLQLSLNTGTESYPWTATLSGRGFTASPMTGSVSASPGALTVTANPAGLPGGTYTGALNISCNVNGDVLSTSIAVSVHVEASSAASGDGVALTKTPGWQRLTRTLRSSDALGLGVSWTATSNQPWLSVTPSGPAQGDLSLTANPAGLPVDSISYATVTISSSDPATPGSAAIQVGLWVGSTTPSNTVKLPVSYTEIEPDPIRPYVYVHDGAQNIIVYNVYTSAVVTTITGVAPQLGDMVASSDGAKLFAVDRTNWRIVPVDLATNTPGTPWNMIASSGTAPRLEYARPGGFGVILAGDGRAYAANTGARMSPTFAGSGMTISASRNGRMFVVEDQGYSPSSTTRYTMSYSATNGGTLTITQAGGTWNAGSNGREVAVNADGSRYYTACGAPYVFSMFSGTNDAFLGSLPGNAYPNSIKVASDGRIFAGAQVYYDPVDVWIYRPDGYPVTTFHAGGYAKSLLPRQLVASGDAMMAIGLTDEPRLVFMPVGP